MYVSPAVRTIRDDPVEGESVTLLLAVADDAAVEAVAAAVEAAGGTVEAELEFRTLKATVAHERVGAVCEADGIDHVETGNTLGIDPDGAGEDVRPNVANGDVPPSVAEENAPSNVAEEDAPSNVADEDERPDDG